MLTEIKRKISEKRWLLTVLTAVSILLFPSAVADAYSEAVPQQEWSMTYGAYQGRVVIQTSDGGYAVSGENASYTYRGYTGESPCLIKTDSSGKLEWGKTYGNELGGFAISLVQTNDLGYALCGDGWLLKTDAQGNLEWNKTFNIEVENGPAYQTHALFWSIIKTNDAGLVLTGFGKFENSSYFGCLLKTDENGNVIWNRIISSSGNVIARHAVQTNDGGYALAGNLDNGAWFARTDPEGNIILSEKPSGKEIFSSITETDDGGFVLTSNRGSLLKVDASGNKLWGQSYISDLSAPQIYLESVVQASNEGYLAAGLVVTGNNYAWLIRTDASGNLLWNVTYGQKSGDQARSIINANDGGFVVAGTMNDSIWLAKFSMEQALTPTPSIPEFQSWTVLTASVTVLSAIVMVFRKKSGKTTRTISHCAAK